MRLSLKTLKRRSTSWAIGLLTLVGAGTSALAAPIEVNNASFERPALEPGGWSNDLPDPNNPISGSNWIGQDGPNNGNTFIEFIPDFSSEGGQHLGMQANYYVFQNTGTPWAPNTTYTLTVGVGNRGEPAGALTIIGLTNLDEAPGPDNRLADANANAQLENDPLLAAASVTVDSGANPALSFTDNTVSYTTGAEAPAGNIVIFLGDEGAADRSHFDNVRLYSQPAGTSIGPDVEFQTAARAGNPIVLDGDLSEWTATPIVNAQSRPGPDGTTDLAFFEPFGGGTWDGPDDHSNTTWLTWDDDNVYVGIIVTDDYHEHAATGPGGAWNGDAVQLHVANGARDTNLALYNYALEGIEGATGIVQIHDEAGPGGSEAVITRVGTSTTYEIKLPKSSIGIDALAAGVQLGIGMTINDGDELEPGQKGWGGLGTHSIVYNGKTTTETAQVTLGGASGTLLLDFGSAGPNANGTAPGWIPVSNLAQDVAFSLGGGVSVTALEDGFNPNNPAGPGADGFAPQAVLDDYLFKITDAAGTSAVMRFDGLAAGNYDVTVFEGRTTDSGQFGKIWVGEEPSDPNTGDFAAGKSGTVAVSVAEGDAVFYRHLEDGSGGVSGMIIAAAPGPELPQGNGIDPAEEFQDASKSNNPIVLDGNLSEWASAKAIVNPRFRPGADGTDDLVTFEPFGGGTWDGPADQSSTVFVTYDDDNVYVGVVVTDDYHENAAVSAWNGDAVQLMIANGARDTQVGLYNFALGGVDGALGALVVNDEAGPGGSDAIVVRDADAKTTTYEIKLPKAALALDALVPGVQFGLGFTVNDGDEAEPGQKGWGGLGAHSIVFGKSPGETALFTLTAPVAPVVPGFIANGSFDFADGTTDLGDGSTLSSNTSGVGVYGGALRLTEFGGVGGGTAFVLPPGFDGTAGWTMTFDFSIENLGDDTNTPADGFSVNYGAIPGPDNYGNPAEEGYGEGVAHVSYQVDTWLWNDAAGQDAGVGIEVAGVEVALNKAADDNANFKPNEKVSASAVLVWDPERGASFVTEGLRTNADFIDVATPDFVAEAGHGFSILARVGGHNETVEIDNLVLTVGAVQLESAKGLIAHWPLDEITDGVTPDVVGGNNMTAVNLTADDIVSGAVGGAVAFDAARETMLTHVGGDGSALPVNDNYESFSIGFWTQTTGTGQNDLRLFSEGSTTDNTPLFNIGTANDGADGTVDFYIRGSDGNPVNHVHSVGAALDGAWHHVLYTEGGGTAALYIDGAKDAVELPRGDIALSNAGGLDTTTIGGILRAVPSHWVTGTLDDVKIWNYSLSDADAAAEFAAVELAAPNASIVWSDVNPDTAASDLIGGSSITFTPATIEGIGNAEGTFFTGDGGATGNADLDAVYNSHAYFGAGFSITLDGLTAGTEYQIQLLGAGDTRGCCDTRTQTGDDLNGNVSGEFVRGNSSVVGTFTAVGSTQVIAIAGATDPGLSGYVLADGAGVLTAVNLARAADGENITVTSEGAVVPYDEYANGSFDFADGTTDLGDGSSLSSNTTGAGVLNGALRLTEFGGAGGGTAFVLPPGFDGSSGWTMHFDFSIENLGDENNTPADGFSVNFGDIPGSDNYGAPAEDGYGPDVNHVSYQVDTWKWDDPAQDSGVGVAVTGVVGAFSPAVGDTANFKPNEKVSATAWLTWDPAKGASFVTEGLRTNASFIDVSTEGFTASAASGFSIIARVGGHNESLDIDNLTLVKGAIDLGGPEPVADGALKVRYEFETGEGNVVKNIAPPASSPLADGLIAYFPLDSDLEDKVGDAHGFAVGTAPIVFADGGIDLDGVDQYVSTPVETEGRFDFSDDTGFTVSAWFRVDSFDKSWQAIVTKGEGSNWRIHRQGDTDNLGPVAGNGDFVANPVSVNDGALHHVVITNVPGESTNFYLDGVLNESRPGGIPEGNEWPMMIGENANGGGNGRTFNGLIDEVAVWNRALGDDEVALIFNGPSIGEQTSGGGGAASVTSGAITDASQLDFSGDIVYAVAARGPGGAVIGDATFTNDDETAGLVRVTQNEILDWGTLDLAEGADNDALEAILNSIRWSAANDEPTGVSYDLDVAPGNYKVTLLFHEQCCDRGFDVTLNGELIADNFSPNAEQEAAGGVNAAGAFLTYEGPVNGNTLSINLDGTNTEFPDKNAIISGLVVESLGGGGPAAGAVLADSVADWAGTEEQGVNGWTYGYRPLEFGGPVDYDPADFVAFDTANGWVWTGTQWDWGTGDVPWTAVANEDGHPNTAIDDVTNTTGSTLQHAVRRWVSNVDGPVNITYHGRETNLNGGGVVVGVHINGVLLESAPVTAGDAVGFTSTVTATLAAGDVVDCFLSPTDNDGTEADGSDGSAWSMVVTAAGDGSGPVNGTLISSNAAAWQSLNPGASADGPGYMWFDSANGADVTYIDTGLTPSDLGILGAPYTMMAFVRQDALGDGNDGDAMIFGQDTGAVLHNGARGANLHQGHWGADINGGSVVLSEWRHIAYTWDGTNSSILVNGQVVQTGAVNGLTGVDSNILIGTTNLEGNRDFIGGLDDVRIYCAALTPGQIEAIACSSPIADCDGDGIIDSLELALFGNLDRDGMGDLDGDRLNDATEIALGTDPNNRDTDGDGLWDGAETFAWSSNPLVVDSDGDGLSDGAEVTVSDPNDDDTNNDGILDGADAVSTISMNFVGQQGADGAPGTPSEAGDVTGVVSAGNWNNVGPAIAGSTSGLVDGNGADSGIEVTWSAATMWTTFAPGAATNATSRMMDGYLDDTADPTEGGDGEYSFVNITNIPYASYDIIAYFTSDGNDRSGAARANGSAEVFFTTFGNNDPVEFIEATAGAEADAAPATYAVFSGLSGDALFEWRRISNNVGLAGLQIVGSGGFDGNAVADALKVYYEFDQPNAPSVVYSQNFDALEGASDLGDGSTLFNEQAPIVVTNGALPLTLDDVDSQNANWKLPPMDGLAGGFVVEFDLALFDAEGGLDPADGFSFNLGNIPDDAAAGEEGFGAGLAVEFDTWNNDGEGADNGIGIDISVDGADLATNREAAGANANNNAFFNFDGQFRHVKISFAGGLLDVTYGDLVIASGLDAGGWAPADGDRIAFGARTGGANETVLFDNMVVSGPSNGRTVVNHGNGGPGTLIAPDGVTLADVTVTALGDPTEVWNAAGAIPTMNGTHDGADVLDATWRALIDFDAKTEGVAENIFETGAGTIGLSLVYEAPSTLVMRSTGLGGLALAVASAPLSQAEIDAGDVEVVFTHDSNPNGPETLSIWINGQLGGSGSLEKGNDWSGGDGGNVLVTSPNLAGSGANSTLPGGNGDFVSGTANLDQGIQFFRDTLYQTGVLSLSGGSDIYVDTNLSAAATGLGGSTYTALARIQLNDLAGDNMVFGQATGNVLHNGVRDAAFHQGHWGNDTNGGSVEVGVWYDVAWRYTGNVQTIFVNGEVAVSGVDKGPLGELGNILIGATRLDEDRSFNGSIDYVQIYCAALSAAQIRTIQTGDELSPQLLVHYQFEDGITTTIRNDGNLGAPHGSLNSLDVIGAHGSGSPTTGNGVLNFDATGNADATYIDTGLTAAEASLNGDINYTMMSWIKPTRDSAGDQMIFGQSTGSALHNGIRDQRLHIGHWGNDLGSGASAVTFNAWQHVAFTYEGGIQTIYINGEVTESAAFGGLNNPDENILIGTTVLGEDRDYEGALDDVRIYNGALSATQIAAVAGLIDSDGDGILDPIERGFFGDLAMDGNGDPDEDGQTTAQELAGGSNPTVFTQFEREDGAVIEILGVGVEALLGGDLTDPENDGLDEAGAANDPSWNWVNITSNIEPDFGDPEQSFNIFDNQVGGGGAKWCCDDPSVDNPYWVSVEFAQPVSLTHFTITNGNDSPDRDPTNWQIQGSNDGENFETIFEESTKSIWTAERNEVALVTLGSASLPYTHIRYLVLDTPGSLHQLNEIEYFGDFFDPNGPAPGLIAYWDFNGSGDPVDLVNGTVAALTGGADYGDGYEGGAIDFGATDEGQTLVVDPSILAPIAARDKLTISYWQNLHNVADSSAFWADAAVAGDRAFQAHTPWSNGSVYFDTAGCCDPPQRISAAVDTPVGTWQHFAFVKDGPNKAVYVDGVEAFAGGDAAPIPEGFLSFNIGSANDGASSIQGLIDEFSIWSVALSADEIADLAAGGKPFTGGGGSSLSAGLIGYWPLDGDLEDKVGDAHGFEVGSAPIEFGDGGFGQGVDLDGIDQYVSTPVETEDRFDFSDDTGFSVSAWFRVDSFDKSWQAIVTKGEGSNWRIHRQGDTDNLGPVAGNGDFVANPVSVNDGALHHVVITNVPGESTNFYLDGVLNESRAAGIPEGNEWPMMIGENANGGGNGRTFNGLIDEVAVWNRALSDGEVGLLYSGPSLGEQISGGGGDDPRASAAAQSSGPITSPTLVDFGVLSGDASYEFSANIVKLGPSTAVAGNDAWALKWEQWNETGFFGSTEFGVVDNTSEAPTVFGADTHVVFVSDTAAGETLIYVNGALSGSVPGNPLLSGPGAVFGARDGTTDPTGDGSVLHGWATYDFALSADDVAALAATPFGGGGGMVVYSEDFSQEDGTTDLGDGSTLSSNTTGAGVFGGELQLTEFGGAGGGTAFVLPAGIDVSSGWTATFDFSIENLGDENNTPADGFSFNYGAIPAADNYGDPAEEGYGTGVPHVSFQVDTWLWNDAAGQDAGVGIEVTGVEVALNKAADDDANFKPNEKVSASATVGWDPVNGATFTTEGLRTNADFVNVATPGFTAEAGHGFSFLARVGGHNETVRIDNLVITVPDGGGIAGQIGSWAETQTTTAADHVDLGTLPQIDLDTDFTWAFSVNPAETDNNNIVLGNRYQPDGTEFAPREFVKFTPRGFEWHVDGAGQNVVTDATLLEVGVWSHNAVVKSGTTLTYYRNGAVIGSGEITAAPVNPQPLYLGGQPGADGATTEGFSGDFRDVAIFDRALSLEEVQSLVPPAALPYTENFDSVVLGPNVDEEAAGDNVWTADPPAGWTVDNSGMAPGGVTEWRGWTFADPVWWATVDDQRRSEFTKASGAAAIADPDEWDDLDSPSSAGTFNSFLSSPAISVSGESGVTIAFDFSWRPEVNQVGNVTVSFDGGAAEEVFRLDTPTSTDDNTNSSASVAVAVPDGASSMVVTFGMFDAGNNWFWAIDNVSVSAGGGGGGPLNIAFVSFHDTDAPSADAAAADPPITEASDIGYTNLLTANGHTVTRVLSRDDPTADDATTLNDNFDLIIVSRAVASNHFQEEAVFWNELVTIPVMNLGGYTFRNSRLNWTDGGTMVDTDGPVTLAVEDASHPIFAGVDLSGPYANFIEGERGVSFNMDNVVGGTVLATAADTATAGGAAIFEFATGAVVNNDNVIAAPRLAFLTGSRELDRTSQTAGFYDLTASGEQMFLNAVNYMGGGAVAAAQRATVKVIADADSDGQSDSAEAIAGTDPNNAMDFLHVSSIKGSSLGMIIEFDGVVGRAYEIEFSTDLAPNSWSVVGSKSTDEEDSTVQYLHMNSGQTATIQGFYRARVVQD